MKKIILKNLLSGLLFSFGFFGGIILLVKAAGLTATTGEPLTVSKWTDMAANFFWGSGSGGIYYNGKVGIGINAPNKSLHIYDTINNAEIDLQSVSGSGKHWAIYQDKNDSHFYIWNTQNNLGISTGGNVDANGRLNGKGGLCINGDCKTAWSQVGSSVTLNYTGTCDSAHKGASGIISNTYKVCNGTMWIDIVPTQNYFAGVGTAADPYRGYLELASATTVTATSCNYYNLNAYSLVTGTSRLSGPCGFGGSKECLTSGIYRIDPDGAGGTNAFNVYCDMSIDGGGWLLVVRIVGNQLHSNTAAVGTFSSYDQTTSWKYTDSLINTIPKTVGYKLTCNGTSSNFTTACTFAANTIGTSACNTGGYGDPRGLCSYPNSGQLFYGHSTQNGCRDGSGNWTQSGRVYIK